MADKECLEPIDYSSVWRFFLRVQLFGKIWGFSCWGNAAFFGRGSICGPFLSDFAFSLKVESTFFIIFSGQGGNAGLDEAPRKWNTYTAYAFFHPRLQITEYEINLSPDYA